MAPELAGIDLNLLVVLHALLEARNVTRAAAKVGLSQSATSHALARLRQLYADPLLVRSGRNLEPTARAVALLPVLDRALGELHGTISSPARFEAKAARRLFRFGTSDYGEVVLCEPLLKRLAKDAPGIDLDVSGATNPLDLLDDGKLDLAAVVQHAPRSGHSSVRLFDDDFVCMVRRGHPVLGSRLTLRRYLELHHAVVAPAGGPGSLVDSILTQRGFTRRVAVRIPTFIVAPIIVAGSDLINTGPSRLGRRMAEIHPIVLLPAPLPLPHFTFSLAWHKRFDADPAHTWFRELVVTIARDLAAT